MKKIILIVAVAGLVMTSCKREHLCNCVSYIKKPVNDSVYKTEGPYTLPVPINGKTKKKDAKAQCDALNGVTTQSDFSEETTYVSCTVQ